MMTRHDYGKQGDDDDNSKRTTSRHDDDREGERCACMTMTEQGNDVIA